MDCQRCFCSHCMCLASCHGLRWTAQWILVNSRLCLLNVPHSVHFLLVFMCFIQSPFDFENPQPLPNGFLALVLALCSSHSLRWPVFSAVVWWEGSVWYALVPLLMLLKGFFVPYLRVSFLGSFLSIKVLSAPFCPF